MVSVQSPNFTQSFWRGRLSHSFKSLVFLYCSFIFIRTAFYNRTAFLGRHKHFLCSLMACLGLHTFTLYASCIFMCMAREESCHLCAPRGVWKLDCDTNHKNRQWARSQKAKPFSFLSTFWFPIDCSGKLPSSHSQSLGQQQKKKNTRFLSTALQRLTNLHSPAASLHWLTHH